MCETVCANESRVKFIPAMPSAAKLGQVIANFPHRESSIFLQLVFYNFLSLCKILIFSLMNDSFIFFWGHTNKKATINKTCFSQWYVAPFEIDGKKYICAEQYMMEQKAMLFDNVDIAQKIMETEDPSAHKALGREITGFVEEKWNQHKYQFVLNANYAKFSQNQLLKDFLLSTGGKILVEASPYDKIWGIGMSASDENITNPSMWQGQNLLGLALMQVREFLRNE